MLQTRYESPQETIRMLQRELAETNREVMALTLELEKRVEERTTALHEAQQQLEHKNARLEAANKELEAFSSSVSHDLRAPLRHLQGFTEALVEDYRSVLGEQGQQYLTHITNAVAQMNALIDALLGFARTSQQPLHQTDVDFNGLVHKILSEMQPEQAGRRIEWIVPSLPAVHGDPTLLRQVWVNLIENALKYTRNKDSARIELGWRNESRHELVFFVKDNGAGFDMSHSEQLFGLFHRLHRADEFEGVGLGLANVRRIIDRHGGRTWAEGEVGKGASFYFSLPKHSR